MPRILAIDSSTSACSVAILSAEEIQESFTIAPQRHTQLLLPLVDEILASHELSLSQLDAIAFAGGPGSFTGLRICLGVVQGLAFGANLPVIKISTLQAMSASAIRLLHLQPDSLVLPALDARMNEVYWGIYQSSGEGPIELHDDSVNLPDAVVANELFKANAVSIVGVGDGWDYPELQQIKVGAVQPDHYPHAYDVASLAKQRFLSGEVDDVFSVSPTYVRNEVRWKKHQKIRR